MYYFIIDALIILLFLDGWIHKIRVRRSFRVDPRGDER